MDTLGKKLQDAIQIYAGTGNNVESHVTVHETNCVFALVSIGNFQGKPFVETGIVARFEGERNIIEKDGNNKLLVDALLQAGVPEEQIELRDLDEHRRAMEQG